MRTRSLFVFGVCLVAFCLTQGVASEDCEPDEDCTGVGGYCYTKGFANCNGTSFNYGCKDKACACCVEDTSVCIPDSHCLKRNGTCIGLNDTCTGKLLNDSCKGDDCQCCVHEPSNFTVECTITPKCTEYEGYCFAKGEHQCNGNEFNKGCKDVLCSCCVQNTTICIEKPFCENDGGKCQNREKDGECSGTEIPGGCQGDDCICCLDV